MEVNGIYQRSERKRTLTSRNTVAQLACIASVSARVRRDIWDEIFFFFCSRSNNQSITRLETLATQAMAQRTLQLTRVGRNLIQRGPNSWEKGEKNLWNQDIQIQICIKRFWQKAEVDVKGCISVRHKRAWEYILAENVCKLLSLFATSRALSKQLQVTEKGNNK